MNKMMLAAIGFAVLTTTQVAAETCGGVYTVQSGDSLSLIADNLYKDAGKWSVIHQANITAIGESPNRIVVGQEYSLPCVDGLPTGLPGGTEYVAQPVAPTPRPTVVSSPVLATNESASAPLAGITILTADDFAPFTDRSLPNGGLAAEVVDAAMAAAAPDQFQTYWVNDWSAHLDPLLSNSLLDMGHPWSKPDCEGAQPDAYRCVNFHFSEPIFEFLILLFVNAENPIPFNSDDDLLGKTLCRPAGYFTHDLDKNGRNWVADGLINLERPTTVADCFEMLVDGTVDAVTINEFTGRTAISDLELEQQVSVVDTRPVAIEGLYVVVAKTHPQAEAMMDLMNSGLNAIKESGQYQQIVDQHMSAIWAKL